MEQALGNAQNRIAELESQGGRSAGGFLDPNAWGNSAQTRPSNPVPGMEGGRYQPGASGQQTASTASAAPAQGGFMRGGAGSMLGTVAATAAGVAAGSFLFHGIGNLLGNNGHDASNHLLADNAAGGAGADGIADQSGSSLADQAGLGAIDEPGGGLDDSLADNVDDEPGGFFDGDGSDEGLFG